LETVRTSAWLLPPQLRSRFLAHAVAELGQRPIAGPAALGEAAGPAAGSSQR
jgi:hypothetical protein